MPSALEDATRAKALTEHIEAAVRSAPCVDAPFPHLELRNVFPADVYARMLADMPSAARYRAMRGRSKTAGNTRIKLDLLPEFVRHLPAGQRRVWNEVGAALRSPSVQRAFSERLSSGLHRRFGPKASGIAMYSIPILTRDFPGYSLPPHTDTHWKGITVQLYLPADAATAHIGTVFHARRQDGGLPEVARMPFLPNSGYAFAVGDDTWHSVDPVGPEVTSRDSILLTYFVDRGLWRRVRNRGKRLGNLILVEGRGLFG